MQLIFQTAVEFELDRIEDCYKGMPQDSCVKYHKFCVSFENGGTYTRISRVVDKVR
jgi:hypothetical protein